MAKKEVKSKKEKVKSNKEAVKTKKTTKSALTDSGRKTAKQAKIKEINLQALLKAGAHFGHKTSKWNPKMDEYIFTQRQGVHIINLEKTRKKLEEALAFAQDVVSKKGVILFVGTKDQSKEAVSQAALKCGMPYVTERWLGGTFTNFKIIYERIKKLRTLEEDQSKGGFDKYTKREQMKFKEEIDKLNRFYEGVKNLSELPQAVFIVDVLKEKIVVKEAKRKNIPIVGLVDTDGDPEGIDYVIPGNDDALSSIQLICNAIAEAIIKEKDKSKSNKVTK